MFLGNDPNFIAYKSKLRLHSKETRYRASICFLFFAMLSTQNSTLLLLCKFISSMSHEKKESVKNFLKSSRPFLLFVVGGLVGNQKTFFCLSFLCFSLREYKDLFDVAQVSWLILTSKCLHGGETLKSLNFQQTRSLVRFAVEGKIVVKIAAFFQAPICLLIWAGKGKKDVFCTRLGQGFTHAQDFLECHICCEDGCSMCILFDKLTPKNSI